MSVEDAGDRIADLVQICEDLREQGRPVVIEEVCAGRPELAAEVARRFRALLDVDRMLAPVRDAGPALAEARTRYEIGKVRGRGGQGEVFEATEADLKRAVALKFIRPRLADDPGRRDRFLFEAVVTGRLQHPGVVPVYAMGSDEHGRPCFAMRMIDGEELKAAIAAYHDREAGRGREERRKTLRELLGRFVMACETVAYAHSKGVLHRDLTPKNIMLGEFGETLVVDWGLAKPFGMDLAAAGLPDGPPSVAPGGGATWAEVGTPAYFSPEQAAGGPTGPAADVYGLGATLYHILAGVAPRQGDREAVVEAARRNEHRPVRAVDPSVPPGLAAVVDKAMAMRPEDRYPSAKALAEDVRRWLDDEPVAARRDPFPQRALRWTRRNSTLAASLVFLTLLASGSVVSWSWVRAARAGEALQAREADHQREIAFYNRVDALIQDYEVARARAGSYANEVQGNVRLRALLDLVQSDGATIDLVREAGRQMLAAIDAGERTTGEEEAEADRTAERSLRAAVRLVDGWKGPGPLPRATRGELGRAQTAIGERLVKRSAEPAVLAEALAWVDRGGAILRALAAEPGAGPADRGQLGWNLEVKTNALMKLGRYSEALEVAAIEAFPKEHAGVFPVPGNYAWGLTLRAAEVEQSRLPWSRGPGADHAKARRLAEFLASRPGVSDAAVYNAACACALGSVDASASAREREERASSAVAYLGRIAAAGYFRAPSKLAELGGDADLDPLRGRADFRELLRRVEGR